MRISRLSTLTLITLFFLIYITRPLKTTTVISAHIGKTYEGVARDSTNRLSGSPILLVDALTGLAEMVRKDVSLKRLKRRP
jgi:hypothetical protein